MSAYNKLLKKGTATNNIPNNINNNRRGNNTNNRILTQSEDSDGTQRGQNNNVFLDSSQQYIGFNDLIVDKNANSGNSTGNRLNIANSGVKSGGIGKKQARVVSTGQKVNHADNTRNKAQQIQLVDDEQVLHQGHSQPSQHTSQQQQQSPSLSIFQSFTHYSGQLTHHTKYPYTKLLAINNNNDQENLINRRLLKEKKKTIQTMFAPNDWLSETNQYYFQNSVKVGWLLGVWHVVWEFLCRSVEWYLFVGVMVAGFVVQSVVFQGNAQYVGDPVILLVVGVVYLIGNLILEHSIIKKRRNFAQNEAKFKVYHHDGVSAQWNMIQANQLKAGHVYKVPGGSKFPTDAILLHSARSILHVDERDVRSTTPEPLFTPSLKQTLIKSQTIVLPISGILEYTVSSAQQKTTNWFEGSLRLQQPISIKHNVTTQNFVYKNSINLTSAEVLCMALEVGSSSIHMKNTDYPHLWKDNEIIMERRPQVLTIKKFNFYFLCVACVGYVLLSSIGLLIGFLTQNMSKGHFQWGEEVKASYLVFYHFTNFVILIPVFVNFSLLCYAWIMGSLTESNISSRRFQFSEVEVQNSISQTYGTLAIKDYSIVPYLSNPVTLVSGIQIFKEKKSFALKKIVVKEAKFDFEKQKIEDDLIDEEQRNLFKSFMTVTLLTTISSKGENAPFESSIKKMAKQHLNLKLNQQKDFYSVTGPLESVFTDGKLEVIHYFTVKGCRQHPFLISFYQIPAQNAEQNPQRRVLCLLRGDPQTILMKAYGKKINLLTESDRLHQDNGFQVHFIGKFTMFLSEAQILKDFYESATVQKSKFYQMLDPFIQKIEPMGLLAFENEYSHENISSMKSNPFLNMSMLNQARPNSSGYQNQQIFTSTHFPPTILINPSPDPFALHPQFQSVNTINRILGNHLLFNFSQKQISDKILYDPIPVEEMIQKMNRERVVVWNGWDNNNVTFMLNAMKEKGVLLVGMIEKQEEVYLAKVCDYTVSSCSTIDSNDPITPASEIHPYTDITITQPSSTPKITKLFMLLQLLNHDSHVMYNGLYRIILVHIVKFVCYFVVQAINFYFTLGSGLSLVRLPLYAVTEVVVLFDVFYYLNVRDGVAFGMDKRKMKEGGDRGRAGNEHLPSVTWLCVKTLAMCLAGTMIIIHSSITPHTSTGTPTNSVFCTIQTHLFITHLIILSKLSFTPSITLYQLLILLIQLGSYYIGLLIVSQTSLYEFDHVFAYALNNKLFLVSVVCVWVFLVVGFGERVLGRDGETGKQAGKGYQQLKRVNKDTNLEVIQVEEA